MEIKVSIWSNLKERDKNGHLQFRKETNFNITEEDVLQLALEEYFERYSDDESREYKAEIDKISV